MERQFCFHHLDENCFGKVSHLWRFQIEHLQRLGRRGLAEVDGPGRAVGSEKLGQPGHVDVVVVVEVAPPAVSRTQKDIVTSQLKEDCL